MHTTMIIVFWLTDQFGYRRKTSSWIVESNAAGQLKDKKFNLVQLSNFLMWGCERPGQQWHRSGIVGKQRLQGRRLTRASARAAAADSEWIKDKRGTGWKSEFLWMYAQRPLRADSGDSDPRQSPCWHGLQRPWPTCEKRHGLTRATRIRDNSRAGSAWRDPRQSPGRPCPLKFQDRKYWRDWVSDCKY